MASNALNTVAEIKIAKKNLTNETEICATDTMPDIITYYEGLGITWISLLISASIIVFICVLILFLNTMRFVAKTDRRFLFKDTSIVVGVYTIVCMCSVFTLSIPRAQPLCEAVSQVFFMIAIYSFFNLLVKNCSSCDGELRNVTEIEEKIVSQRSNKSSFCCDSAEQQMFRAVNQAERSKLQEDVQLMLRAPPCCCWPCLRQILHDRPLKESHITILGYLILQMPFATALVYFVLLVMASEHQRIYNTYYQYLQPICLVSILLGIYGINVTIKLVAKVLPERPLQSRFKCLQLVLLSTKLQALLIRLLASNGVIPCLFPLAPALVATVIQNSLVLCEMLMLAVWASFIYRNPISMQDENTPINIAVNSRNQNNNAAELAAVATNTSNRPRPWTENKDNAFVIENQFGVVAVTGKQPSITVTENSRKDVHM